jgi:hypothetical protein
MVDAPITCSLLNHSMSFHTPAVRKKQRASTSGPEWDEDKSAGFCHSCGFQFNVLIRYETVIGEVSCQNLRWFTPAPVIAGDIIVGSVEKYSVDIVLR